MQRPSAKDVNWILEFPHGQVQLFDKILTQEIVGETIVYHEMGVNILDFGCQIQWRFSFRFRVQDREGSYPLGFGFRNWFRICVENPD